MNKTTIFIKSYPGDYRWLGYLLRSIQKYVTGYHEIVVALPTGRPLPLTKERIVYVDEWPDNRKPSAPTRGYYHQMFVKLCADIYVGDADAVFYVDSDCLFNRPFDMSEMYHEGKPLLLRRRWEDAGDGIVWRAPGLDALGWDPNWDTMCVHPTVYWADSIRNTRHHIEKVHRKPLEVYARAADRITEFIALGNYVIEKEPDRYSMVDYGKNPRPSGHSTIADDGYPRPCKQYWSHGGFTPEIEAEVERVLA